MNTENPNLSLEKGKRKAFTLVELIIVITILSILATIAFISFQGYASKSRDANRASTLKNIETGLSIFDAKAGKYPSINEGVEILGNAYEIGKQSEFDDAITRQIQMNEVPKDPLTDTPYLYATTKEQSKYQLLGFFEGESSLLSSVGVTKSYALDQEKYVRVFGDSLGILTNSDGTFPSETSVDLVTTPQTYRVYFSDTSSLTGTGDLLKAALGGGDLVGYWDFDETSGTLVHDKSGNENTGTFSGTTTLSWTSGKLGGALDFWANTGQTLTGATGVDFGRLKKFDLNHGKPPFSVTAWVYMPQDLCTSSACRQWVLLLGTPGKGSMHWLVGGTVPTQIGIRNGFQFRPQYTVGSWMFWSIVFDGTKYYSVVDGNLYTTDMNTNSFQNGEKVNFTTSAFIIGKHTEKPFTGKIDDVRVYDRALSVEQVMNIYHATK